MADIVSKTLLPLARRHLKSTMVDSATLLRTGTTVPCLVVVMRLQPFQLNVSQGFHLRVRRWRIIMPNRTDALWGGVVVATGDRLSIPGHGVFMVTEVTDPNTYNASTDIVGILCNASVTFDRPQVTGCTVGPVDVYIGRVSDEMAAYGILYDWEVWFDSSIRFPGTPLGGTLISKQDEMQWGRSPNPFPGGGNAVLDAPRYAYTHEGAVVIARFKEAL